MIHPNHLATPQKMTDGSGTVVWSADYKPFGEATVTVSTITNNLRFPGQYYDAETGLNYNLNRDYNSVIGRYIAADPLNLGTMRILFPKLTETLDNFYKFKPGSQSLYVYVENNSLNKIDPVGLAEEYPTDPGVPLSGHPVVITDYPWQRISPKTKCKLLCKVAFILLCAASGFGIGVGTDNPALGTWVYRGCSGYFTILCSQICSCQQ